MNALELLNVPEKRDYDITSVDNYNKMVPVAPVIRATIAHQMKTALQENGINVWRIYQTQWLI